MNEDVATADADRDAILILCEGRNAVVPIERFNGDASAARAALLARLERQAVVSGGNCKREVLYDDGG